MATFTAPSNSNLDRNTRYAIVLAYSSFDKRLLSTASNAQTSGAGFTLDDAALESADSGSTWTAESGGNSLMIRVNGTAIVNSPAAGAPTISVRNVFRVPATLTADISAITDENGKTNIETNATYRWQRFAADGVTLEMDNIGTGPTLHIDRCRCGQQDQGGGELHRR